MRHLLNTLYVTNEKSYLSLDNENVIIKLNIKFPGLKVIGNWNEGPAESVIDFIKR